MMKFFKFKNLFTVSALAFAMFTSCSDDNNPSPEPNPEPTPEVETRDFHVALASGTGSISATYLQGISDLSQGAISSQVGYEMESSRTARIFVSEDGNTIYSLNYTVGTIEKLSYLGADQYKRVSRMDASVPLGATAVRFTKLSDKEASVHYIAATPEYDKETGKIYQKHKMTASIGILDLETMEMKDGYNKEIDVVLDEDLAKAGYYISRIDAPVLSGDKLYYGAAVKKFDAATGKNAVVDLALTFVIDYPSLTNATAIYTKKVVGSTNGYRTPTQHKNEAGEILQMVSGNDEVHIVKVKDGKYDESFDFNLSEKLGKAAASNGWFYVGDGIGYIPYEDLTTPSREVGVDPNGNKTTSAWWKLARMDFNKGTVVDLEVPDNLWLEQFQTAIVRDGIFYIPLSPIGVNGNIYMFDVTSDSPKGTKGATISGTGVDQYYIGIY